MTDRPIIFSAPMVCALLEGRKTMTRRLSWWKKVATERKTGRFLGNKVVASPWRRVAVGDRLWVREAAMHNGGSVCYRADGDMARVKWSPSIHMPRAWSRLTLIVTAVKSELLQDISETDARAEGIVAFKSGPTPCFGVKVEGGYSPYGLTAVECFMNLFCDLHGLSVWKDSPEVVAMSFVVKRQNVDALKVTS